MITANVFNRVFFVRAAQYGTAFTIDKDGRQYVVTARHVFGEDQARPDILIYLSGKWQTLPVTVVGMCRGEPDVAVLSPSIRMSPAMPMPATSHGIVIGQDLYFLGYPYKMWTHGGDATAGRPVPFIRKGILSSAFKSDDNVAKLYIDATNNLGFSGGPVVFKPTNSGVFHVAGVVAKFKTGYEPVIDAQDTDTGMRVAYNTGFTIAYNIDYALQLIDANPIGLSID